MFPSFSFFGWFDFPIITIFLFLAVFLGTFVFYRLLHQRGAYKEFDIFDSFLRGLFFGFIFGRLVFILTHWFDFGWHPLAWLNIIGYPGINIALALLASGVFFWLSLKRHKNNQLELLDYWARASCLGLIFYNLGLFFDGSGTGYLTTDWWGLRFPNLMAKVHPAQLYATIFYCLLYFWLGKLEKSYRTFDWYRGNRSQAKAGFLFDVFLIGYGLYALIALSFAPATWYVGTIALDPYLSGITIAAGLFLLWKNSRYGSRKKH